MLSALELLTAAKAAAASAKQLVKDTPSPKDAVLPSDFTGAIGLQPNIGQATTIPPR
jgi:hypothetical protein